MWIYTGRCSAVGLDSATKFRDNRLRIDCLDTEKVTSLLDHPQPSDRLKFYKAL